MSLACHFTRSDPNAKDEAVIDNVARNERRRHLYAVLIATSVVVNGMAYAMPSGGQVTAGTGTIHRNGSAMVVRQDSGRMVINWESFGIAAGESVRFSQPDASTIVLNRVLGQDPSAVFGSLSANGQVFLLNPNGILFGRGAHVDVGGLLASTLRLSDTDFSTGRFVFNRDGQAGSVLNQGTLQAAPAGYIALIAPQVVNEGRIAAPGGSVALAAGDKMTITLADNESLRFTIDKGTVDALVANRNLIQADGGQVLLTSRGKEGVLSGVVNNTGVIEARTVAQQGGIIRLLAHGGTADVAGTLDASASSGGNGGFIETSGDRVKFAPAATVTTAAANGVFGQWLIDPVDFTIAAAGGDITGAQLASNLGTANVTILSTQGVAAGNGDINVNDAVSWNSANSLTLQAERHVNVNEAITNAGSGGVVLRADAQGSGTGTVNFAGSGHVTLNGGTLNIYYNPGSYAVPTDYSGHVTANGGSTFRAAMLVNSANQLQDLSTNLSGHYALGKDIDASATSGWNAGQGFAPIGSSGSPFSGSFDGLNRVITGLSINRPAASHVGLFGYSTGTIANVGLTSANITGNNSVGTLAGTNAAGGSINNAYATGSVSGGDNALLLGGLTGANLGNLANSYSKASVTGGNSSNTLGGLTGYSNGVITAAYATGAVTGGNSAHTIGGLIGSNEGSITTSYASGKASGGTSSRLIGGLAGYSFGPIANSYATGAATGGASSDIVGGLIGYHEGTITNAYATGLVTAATNAGGLFGTNDGTVNNAYWNTQTSGKSTSGTGTAAGTGKTSAELMAQANLAGFDFAGTWNIVENVSYPFLRSHFANGVQVISGTATGSSVSTAAGGSVHATAGVGANGFYHMMLASGSIANGDALLAFADDGATTGGHLRMLSSGGHATGTDLSLNTLTASGSGLSLAAFATARGGLSSSGIPYTATASSLTATNGVRFVTDAGSGLNLNGELHASGITLNGSTSLTGNSVLDAGNQTLQLGAANGSFNLTLQSTSNVTQTAASTVSGLALGGAGGVYTLNHAGNAIGSLAANTGSIDLLNNASLGIGALGGINGVTATGGVNLVTTGTTSHLTLNQPISSNAGGNAAVLAAGGNFINNAGANAITTPNGRWLVYSTSPDGNSFGGLASGNLALWNRTYAIHAPGTITESGERYLFQHQPTLTITADSKTKTYGDTVDLTGSVTGLVNAALHGGVFTQDQVTGSVTLTSDGVSAAAPVSGSPYLITAAQSTLSAVGYARQFIHGALTINRKALSLSGVTAQDKVYDGTTDATLASGKLGGVVGNDDVTFLLGGASFADKNAGMDKAVTVNSVAIGGTSANNYSLTTPTGLTASITTKPLTLSGVAVQDKVYDGTAMATLTGATLAGVVSGDDVTLSMGSASFADKNAGTGKSVTVTGTTLGGTDARNYSAGALAGLSGNITPKALTVTGMTAKDKVYDGTTAAMLDGGTLVGVNGNDDVALSTAVADFADKNVGTGKAVSVSGLPLKGGDTGNYALILPTGLSAAISPAALKVEANNLSKIFGTADSALTFNLNSGRLFGSDTLEGALTRVPGEVPGSYAITRGSLANGNYTIAFVDGVLTIKPFVLPDPVQAALGTAILPFGGKVRCLQDAPPLSASDREKAYVSSIHIETASMGAATGYINGTASDSLARQCAQ